mmetsp:Transcript_82325/g.236549  ORF Transcript_82325/g.236549 Transcript_82325/m.236549 type:complete len:185 (-) Transcript_82325:172-726(-)
MGAAGSGVSCCTTDLNDDEVDDRPRVGDKSCFTEEGVHLDFESKPLFLRTSRRSPSTSRSEGFEKMSVGNTAERIDPWTTDILPPERKIAFMGCSCDVSDLHARTQNNAPEDYLADTPAGGTIRLFHSGGAAWVDDEEERDVRIEPEEDSKEPWDRQARGEASARAAAQKQRRAAADAEACGRR